MKKEVFTLNKLISFPLKSTSGIILLAAIPFFLMNTSCSTKTGQQSDRPYIQKVNDWHQDRINSLKQEDSWLSLAGLYKISDGKHSLGSDSTNDIIFPGDTPPQIGTITRRDSSFYLKVTEGVEVLHDSTTTYEMEWAPGAENEPVVFRHHSFIWYIIERRGTYYIRLKNTDHPNFASFEGIKRFPVSKNWRIRATFKPFDSPRAISIPDVLGEVYQDSLYGMLEFEIDGRQYSLAPLGHPKKDEEFFIIFGDKTNGQSTYSGGRYLYISTPNRNGITYIDFNKAYNPPCVFTSFATCPLPPSQNRLEVKVTAGEKMYRESE